MSELAKFFAKLFTDPLYTGIGGVIAGWLSWPTLNIAWPAINEVRKLRRDAVTAADRYAYTEAFNNTTDAALKALNENGRALRALARTQPWPARLFCGVLGYDLETAGTAMLGLASAVRQPGTSTQDRTNTLNYFLVALRAHFHVPPHEIEAMKQALAEMERNG